MLYYRLYNKDEMRDEEITHGCADYTFSIHPAAAVAAGSLRGGRQAGDGLEEPLEDASPFQFL
jgi:hypothetical protein